MSVMSVRLNEKEVKILRTLAKEEHKEKSSVARELMLDGIKYKMMVAYKEGQVSISRLSRALELNLSETIDFLSSFGLETSIHYDDYLSGIETARKVIR